MGCAIKIRGIYSTALTKLLLGLGYRIANPSEEIRRRFGLPEETPQEAVAIRDKDDLQGIELVGAPDEVAITVKLLQQRLLDAVLARFQLLDTEREEALATLLFGGEAKRRLDGIRASVLPTLRWHHRLRIVEPKWLEAIEGELARNPGTKDALETEAFIKFFVDPLYKKGLYELYHLQPWARPIKPRKGTIIEVKERGLIMKRPLHRGRYNGLEMPIEEGDYAISQIEEGAWYIRHTYYSRGGHIKGDYYNINTPVELYPHGAIYIDLEVDVIKRADGPPRIIDEERLALIAKEGYVGEALHQRALAEARRIAKSLK